MLPMQQVLAYEDSAHDPDPNPSLAMLTSSFQQSLPSQNDSISKAKRKRHQSPGPSQEQLSVLRQNISRNIGIPEGSLDAFCFGPKLIQKPPKKNQQAAQTAGGPCVRCATLNTRVSACNLKLYASSILICLLVFLSATL